MAVAREQVRRARDSSLIGKSSAGSCQTLHKLSTFFHTKLRHVFQQRMEKERIRPTPLMSCLETEVLVFDAEVMAVVVALLYEDSQT